VQLGDVCVCQADKDSMRSLGSSPGYEVTFTLINPQPDVLSVTWDVQSAVDSMYMSLHCQRQHPRHLYNIRQICLFSCFNFFVIIIASYFQICVLLFHIYRSQIALIISLHFYYILTIVKN